MILSDLVTNTRTIENFKTLEDRFNKLYDYRFDYSKAVYISSSTKITIVCKVHGEFNQSPNNHLKGLIGACPKCGAKSSTLRQSGSKEDFVYKANITHNSSYTYDNFVYTTARTPSYITCRIHGDFKQSPDNHARAGNGCPHCGSRLIQEKSRKQKCLLYVLYFPKYKLYKVGITTTSIKYRMRASKHAEYSVLLSKSFSTTVEAHIIEQIVLSRLKSSRYKGEKVITSGNTELLLDDPTKYIGRLIKRLARPTPNLTKA